MNATVDLDAMTVQQKLDLMDRLWNSLVQSPGGPPLPEWHGAVLRERAAVLDSDTARISDLDEAFERIRAHTR